MTTDRSLKLAAKARMKLFGESYALAKARLYRYDDNLQLDSLFRQEEIRFLLDFVNKRLSHDGLLLLSGKTSSGKTTLFRSLVRAALFDNARQRQLVLTEEAYTQERLSGVTNRAVLNYGGSSSVGHLLVEATRMGADSVYIDELRAYDRPLELELYGNTGQMLVATMHFNPTSEYIPPQLKAMGNGVLVELERVKLAGNHYALLGGISSYRSGLRQELPGFEPLPEKLSRLSGEGVILSSSEGFSKRYQVAYE